MFLLKNHLHASHLLPCWVCILPLQRSRSGCIRSTDMCQMPERKYAYLEMNYCQSFMTVSKQGPVVIFQKWKRCSLQNETGNISSIKNWKNAKVNLTISYPITQLVLAIFLQRITSQNHTTMQILCDVKDWLLKYSIRVKRLKQRLLTMIIACFRKQVESCKQDLPVTEIPTLPIWSGVSRFDVLPPALPIFTKFSRFIIKFWRSVTVKHSYYTYLLREEHYAML